MTKINYIKNNRSTAMLFAFEYFEVSALYFNKVKTITIGCTSFAEKVAIDEKTSIYRNFTYFKRVAVLEDKISKELEKDEWLKLLRSKL